MSLNRLTRLMNHSRVFRDLIQYLLAVSISRTQYLLRGPQQRLSRIIESTRDQEIEEHSDQKFYHHAYTRQCIIKTPTVFNSTRYYSNESYSLQNILNKKSILPIPKRVSQSVNMRQQQRRQRRRQGKRNSNSNVANKTNSTVQLILIIVSLLDLIDNHRVSSFSSSSIVSSNSITIYNSHFSLLFANKDNDNDTIEWDADSNHKIQKIGRVASYSDNWLLDFHNWDQSGKQTITNSLSVWNEEIRNEQQNIVEWQDSFQRNNLADFTPPMSNGLNCLMVGDREGEGEGDGVNRVKLPWENEPEAKITSLRVLNMEDHDANDDDDDDYLSVTETPIATTTRTQMEEEMETSTAGEETVITFECDDDENCNEIFDSSNDDSTNDDLISKGSITSAMIANCGTNGATVRTELIVSNTKITTTTKATDSTTTTSSTTTNSNKIRVQDPNKQRAAVYDCIVDQGLLDKVLRLENNHEAVRELLEEAAIAIREYGIYVLVTKGLLTTETRTLLEDCGDKVGMEWEFELDGISNDLEVVSVARRFCTGEMPKVGRLSRYQP